MKKIIKHLSLQEWSYKLAIKLIANRIVHGENILTTQYLIDKGWVLDERSGCYIEPNVKERDKIWIQFEHHYYRVWHGRERTFIAVESKVEWFEVYYLLIHGDNGRYQLAGI